MLEGLPRQPLGVRGIQRCASGVGLDPGQRLLESTDLLQAAELLPQRRGVPVRVRVARAATRLPLVRFDRPPLANVRGRDRREELGGRPNALGWRRGGGTASASDTSQDAPIGRSVPAN